MDDVEPSLSRFPPGFARVGRAMGVFRHFCACSRPEPHPRDDIEAARARPAVVDAACPAGRPETERLRELNVRERHGLAELQAVLRHLEVRWQLFNEALFKFCDLEAMLAICTDDVTWSNGGSNAMQGKDQQLLTYLQSRITRKVSLDVQIERITRVSQSGSFGMTLDKEGNHGQLAGYELCEANAALGFFLPRGRMQDGNASNQTSEEGPLMILEKGTFMLQNDQGGIVEEGRQFVLWEQHNATWYIQGYLSFPLKECVLQKQ